MYIYIYTYYNLIVFSKNEGHPKKKTGLFGMSARLVSHVQIYQYATNGLTACSQPCPSMLHVYTYIYIYIICTWISKKNWFILKHRKTYTNTPCVIDCCWLKSISIHSITIQIKKRLRCLSEEGAVAQSSIGTWVWATENGTYYQQNRVLSPAIPGISVGFTQWNLI